MRPPQAPGIPSKVSFPTHAFQMHRKPFLLMFQAIKNPQRTSYPRSKLATGYANELTALQKTNTWTVVPLPAGHKPIG